jgi:hypothetical protein
MAGMLMPRDDKPLRQHGRFPVRPDLSFVSEVHGKDKEHRKADNNVADLP